MKPSPYLPFPDDPAVTRAMLPLVEASEQYQCSEATLRNNAKARRFPAYQQRFGSPVFVLPAEVEEFLRNRPDIRSSLQSFDDAPFSVTSDSEAVASNTVGSKRPKTVQGCFLPASLVTAPARDIELVSRCLVELGGLLHAQVASNQSSHSTTK